MFDRDLVTTLPKLLFAYKHVGLEIIIDGVGEKRGAPRGWEEAAERRTDMDCIPRFSWCVCGVMIARVCV